MKLRTRYRAGVWLRRLRASNADIRDAVADANHQSDAFEIRADRL